MTQADPLTDHAEHSHLIPETFWAVVIRRGRYVAGIALSALLFATVGWKIAAPPPEYAGVSLLCWSGGNGLLSSFLLLLLLLVATAVCTALVHPDSPHMGLCCAVAGMCGLAIRGGTVWSVIWYAQKGAPSVEQHYRAAAELLGVECLQWGIMFGIAEVFARLLHDRFFANNRWILRSGVDLGTKVLEGTRPGLAMMGMSLAVARALRTDKMQRRFATPLAMFYFAVIAFILLAVFLQSQVKGQVIFACFASMYLAGVMTYLAFPRVPALAIFLTVPLTAAAVYFYAGLAAPWPAAGTMGIYPGQAYFYGMRALPIDYIAAGVPGVILGYYWAFWWSLHSHDPAAA